MRTRHVVSADKSISLVIADARYRLALEQRLKYRYHYQTRPICPSCEAPGCPMKKFKNYSLAFHASWIKNIGRRARKPSVHVASPLSLLVVIVLFPICAKAAWWRRTRAYRFTTSASGASTSTTLSQQLSARWGCTSHSAMPEAYACTQRPERLEAITVRGIKTVTADFCMCAGAASDDDQIKAHGWWPYGSNFVSVMMLDVLRVLVVPEAEESEAGDSGEPDESESDEESDSGTESSTSE
ncbi:hypothetical protein B0H14DRAFT_2627988 [Mycena olivaceomarginata]|nr:hypothetical protein B0H14DRAFT_2627988 [Mycena olivaceomarginata]